MTRSTFTTTALLSGTLEGPTWPGRPSINATDTLLQLISPGQHVLVGDV
jgi:hypothetical protein